MDFADENSSIFLQDVSIILEDLARTAGDEAREMMGNSNPHHKGKFDILTDADLKSQEIILAGLESDFPDIPVVSEEQDCPAVSSKTYFVADPIDGTALYSKGGTDWGVTIALIYEGHPGAGVIYLPCRNIMARAASQTGCFLNNQPVKLDQNISLDEGIISCEIGWWLDDGSMSSIGKLKDHCLGIRNLLAATSNAVDVLLGATCAYVHLRGAKVWDLAAGTVAVREAGGAALSPSGDNLIWDQIPQSAILAANQNVADDLIKKFQET
jgi:fructose-1,6-bisphosphatase/inositol monophosphatase family enzyme